MQGQLFVAAIAMIFATGFYGLVITRNLIRVVISLEALTKGATLLTILVGALSGHMAEAQAFAITIIVVEVVVTAVAAGIVINVFHNTGSLDTGNIANLRE